MRRIPNDGNASCPSDRSLLHKAGRIPAAFRLGFPLERAMVVGHAPDPRKHEIPTSEAVRFYHTPILSLIFKSVPYVDCKISSDLESGHRAN